MQKTIDLPGVHVWKSKLSGQYFTAIQVEPTEKTIARCIKFSMPDVSDETITEIMNNPSIIEGNFINFKTGDSVIHRLKVGSFLCKNMYGTLINIDKDHFESIMIPVDDADKDEVIHKYFMCLVEVNFGSTYTKLNIIHQTMKVYPSRKDIIEQTTSYMKNEKSVEIAPDMVFICSITEISEAQYNSFIN